MKLQSKKTLIAITIVMTSILFYQFVTVQIFGNNVRWHESNPHFSLSFVSFSFTQPEWKDNFDQALLQWKTEAPFLVWWTEHHDCSTFNIMDDCNYVAWVDDVPDVMDPFVQTESWIGLAAPRYYNSNGRMKRVDIYFRAN